MHTAGLIMAVVSALAMGLWFGWAWHQRARTESETRLLFPLLLVSGVLIRLTFMIFTPTFYAPDEEPHFNYIRYLSVERALPVQSANWHDGTKEWEYSQPPLYYVCLVPVFRVTQALSADPAFVVVSLRFGSVLLWLANVWLGAHLLKRLQIDDPALRLFVLGMVCLLPTYTFVSAAINNDNLLAPLGSALLVLMAARQRSLKWALACGLLLGLSLLTKQSAIVFIPAFALLIVLECVHHRVRYWAGIGYLAVIFGVAALLFGPWLIRNLQVYGTLTPEYLVPTRLTWPSVPHGLASAVHNLVKSFWAVSGISNNIGYPFPLVGMLFLLLWLFWSRKLAGGQTPAELLKVSLNGPVLAACLLALTAAVVLVIRLGYQMGMGQGRHLFHLLYPIALLLATRWRLFPVKQLELYTAGAAMAYGFGFLMFSLWQFPK